MLVQVTPCALAAGKLLKAATNSTKNRKRGKPLKIRLFNILYRQSTSLSIALDGKFVLIWMGRLPFLGSFYLILSIQWITLVIFLHINSVFFWAACHIVRSAHLLRKLHIGTKRLSHWKRGLNGSISQG